MSRVADAVERAAQLARTSSFTEDDHPWGGLLDMRPPEPEPLDDDNSFGVVSTEAPIDRTPVRMVPRESPAAPPPPIAVDEVHRQHLAALVERVFLQVSVEHPRTVAFSGVGTASSGITAAVAQLVAAQSGASVCVVDANFDAPSLHTHFNVQNLKGLADQMAAGEPLLDAACEVGPNLWLLPAGSAQTRPTIGADAARVRLAQFVARFDFVVIDIEPTASGGDAAGIAPLVDGVVLVLAADATRRETARRSAAALQALGATVLGAVLTNRRFPIPDSIYRRL